MSIYTHTRRDSSLPPPPTPYTPTQWAQSHTHNHQRTNKNKKSEKKAFSKQHTHTDRQTKGQRVDAPEVLAALREDGAVGVHDAALHAEAHVGELVVVDEAPGDGWMDGRQAAYMGCLFLRGGGGGRGDKKKGEVICRLNQFNSTQSPPLIPQPLVHQKNKRRTYRRSLRNSMERRAVPLAASGAQSAMVCSL